MEKYIAPPAFLIFLCFIGYVVYILLRSYGKNTHRNDIAYVNQLEKIYKEMQDCIFPLHIDYMKKEVESFINKWNNIFGANHPGWSKDREDLKKVFDEVERTGTIRYLDYEKGLRDQIEARANRKSISN